MKYKVGDKVICPNVGANAVVTKVGLSACPFEGQMIQVEVDEPFPYFNLDGTARDNPRRKILAHESHIRPQQ